MGQDIFGRLATTRRDELKKIKAEEIVRIQKLFREQFPNSATGIVEVKSKPELESPDTVRLEVRVSNEAEFKKMPSEFEGLPVNTMIVSETRLNQLRLVMEGKAHK